MKIDMKLLLKISFLGTNYHGYQVQPNGISVQQKLNEASRALFGMECDIVGCSRTDSGVHANQFFVCVSEHGKNYLPIKMDIQKIPCAMSFYLPKDIVVLEAKEVPPEFHPRYGVKYKEYEYKIWNSHLRNPFLEGRAWHLPKVIESDKIAEMQKAAQLLVGKFDFASYMASGSNVDSTVRTVYSANVVKEGELITFRVSADGFLYNMVRIFMGTLIDVGYGKIKYTDITEITNAKDRRRAGTTAPACGLYLNRVVY